MIPLMRNIKFLTDRYVILTKKCTGTIGTFCHIDSTCKVTLYQHHNINMLSLFYTILTARLLNYIFILAPRILVFL